MRISYRADRAKASESFVPIGIAGLLMTGTALGWLVYDACYTGIFWGWGILAFILVLLLPFAWVATCYKVVLIDRKTREVSLVYRGGCRVGTSYSLWKPTKVEESLDKYVRVCTKRHYEHSSESGRDVAIYTIYLESDSGDAFPVLRNTIVSILEQEAGKLGAFLSLPTRQGYRSR